MTTPTNPAQAKVGVYVCADRHCEDYKLEKFRMLPIEARAATGRFVACDECGSALALRRIVSIEEAERMFES